MDESKWSAEMEELYKESAEMESLLEVFYTLHLGRL